MQIHYVCRHCRSSLGCIEADEMTEVRLGLHFLTPSEWQDIISYNLKGELIVSITCNYCTEAILAHPELSLVASPLQ